MENEPIWICPECRLPFKLTKDGKLRRHGYRREGGSFTCRFMGAVTQEDVELREIKEQCPGTGKKALDLNKRFNLDEFYKKYNKK